MDSNIFHVVVVLLTLLQDSDGRYAKNSEDQVRDYLLKHVNYSARGRPVLNSRDAVDVTMALHIYAMIDLRWRDERLTWNVSDFGGEDNVNMYVDEIWTPKLFVSNAMNDKGLTVVSPDRGSIVLSSDGMATLGTPLVLSTQCPIHIKYFPFDVQACPFTVFPENYQEARLRLFTTERQLWKVGSREWDLLDVMATQKVLEVHDYAANIPVANVTAGLFCVVLQRDPAYYLSTLVAPSVCLTLMSFATFVTPPDSGERISLGVSMILGLTVFQLLVADILPSGGKSIVIVRDYLTNNFLLACLTIPLTLMTMNIAYGDRRCILMKYSRSRKLLLEVFPRLALIPTYSERLKDLRGVNWNGESDQKMTQEDDENGRSNRIAPETTLPEDVINRSEKRKTELRTMSLVLDRILLVTFIAAFVVNTAVRFSPFNDNHGTPRDVTNCGLL